MLKEATISRIAALAKIDVAKLKEAITAEKETDIEIAEDLHAFGKTELDARDRNKYNEGKTAGHEMLVKDIKKKKGLEIAEDGIDEVLTALEGKVKKESGETPDARLAEKDKTIEHWKKQAGIHEAKVTALEGEKKQLQADGELLKTFPKERNGKFSDAEYLTVIKGNFQIGEKDGKRVMLKDGQPVVNPKDLEPIPVAEVIGGYFKERGWIEDSKGAGGGSGGRGGGNSIPGSSVGKFAKISELEKHLSEQGVDIKGEKGQAMLAAAMKENPEMSLVS